MNIKNKVGIPFILLALICISCNTLHDGVVLNKHVEPERTYNWLQAVKIGNTTIFVPHTMHDDEDYVVTIAGFVDGPGSRERVEHFYVTKKRYDCLKKGDHFYIDSKCSSESNSDTEINPKH